MTDNPNPPARPDLISIVIAGDSHVTGIPSQKFQLNLSPKSAVAVETRTVFVDTAAIALDMVVTFPDGREALNQVLDLALNRWPGLDVKGRPLEAGATVQKQLVLSLGTGLARYDPALSYANRVANDLMFQTGVDFAVPGQSKLPIDPDCAFLPVAVMRDMYEAILQPFRSGLRLLAPRYPGCLWVMCAPPPPADNTAISAFFAGIGAPDILIPSAAVTLKAWLLLRERTAEICREAACHFIDCPPTARDEMGFLKAELVHDGIHGNIQYYTLMTRHIIETVGAVSPAAPEFPHDKMNIHNTIL